MPQPHRSHSRQTNQSPLCGQRMQKAGLEMDVSDENTAKLQRKDDRAAMKTEKRPAINSTSPHKKPPLIRQDFGTILWHFRKVSNFS